MLSFSTCYFFSCVLYYFIPSSSTIRTYCSVLVMSVFKRFFFFILKICWLSSCVLWNHLQAQIFKRKKRTSKILWYTWLMLTRIEKYQYVVFCFSHKLCVNTALVRIETDWCKFLIISHQGGDKYRHRFEHGYCSTTRIGESIYNKFIFRQSLID